jgi:hypothetical protein
VPVTAPASTRPLSTTRLRPSFFAV